MSPVTLRPITPEDVPALTALFHRTVHTVNAADYTPAQLDAWSPAPPDAAAWAASFQGRMALVAEVDGMPAGFADMTDDGYLDRLYVSADHQRMGVASALCDALENACAAPVLETHASITALGFFLRRGYALLRTQQVERCGVKLTNHVLLKIRQGGNGMYQLTIRPGDSLQSAINSLPDDGAPAVIRLKAGEYREKVELRRPHTTLIGAGADETAIVWDDAAFDLHPDGEKRGTFRSYTLLVLADDCRVQGLTIRNDAGQREDSGQCVALFADGDGFTCEDCTLVSTQDTLFTAPLPPREVLKNGFLGPTQFLPRKAQRHTYRRCIIRGDVDFIYGGAAAWFEDCGIVCICRGGREPGGYATAASTPEGQKYGSVFKNCRFTGENVPDASFYLGRPWREFAKTILLDCYIGPHIKPEGWDNWSKPDFMHTGLYAECGCTGPGSDTAKREYARVLTAEEAAAITYADFMNSL